MLAAAGVLLRRACLGYRKSLCTSMLARWRQQAERMREATEAKLRAVAVQCGSQRIF